MEVPGAQGKPRAPERWPESFGRSLNDDFLIEAFSCQVWSVSVLLGRLQVVPGGVELLPGRSLEVRESSELQIGGLRALEEACTITSILRHFSVKFGRFLCFRVYLGSAGRARLRLEAQGPDRRLETRG